MTGGGSQSATWQTRGHLSLGSEPAREAAGAFGCNKQGLPEAEQAPKGGSLSFSLPLSRVARLWEVNTRNFFGGVQGTPELYSEVPRLGVEKQEAHTGWRGVVYSSLGGRRPAACVCSGPVCPQPELSLSGLEASGDAAHTRL